MKFRIKILSLFVFLLILSGCSEEKKNTGETVTATGLRYTEIAIGTGETPKFGEKVTIHYTGYLMDGKKFDSSKDRYKAYTFKVGSGTTLKGWEEGVLTMKVGGKRRLVVPSELAYGERGVQGSIPPNATVVFEIELLSIEPDNSAF